jgi:hypothetical protein
MGLVPRILKPTYLLAAVLATGIAAPSTLHAAEPINPLNTPYTSFLIDYVHIALAWIMITGFSVILEFIKLPQRVNRSNFLRSKAIIRTQSVLKTFVANHGLKVFGLAVLAALSFAGSVGLPKIVQWPTFDFKNDILGTFVNLLMLQGITMSAACAGLIHPLGEKSSEAIKERFLRPWMTPYYIFFTMPFVYMFFMGWLNQADLFFNPMVLTIIVVAVFALMFPLWYPRYSRNIPKAGLRGVVFFLATLVLGYLLSMFAAPYHEESHTFVSNILHKVDDVKTAFPNGLIRWKSLLNAESSHAPSHVAPLFSAWNGLKAETAQLWVEVGGQLGSWVLSPALFMLSLLMKKSRLLRRSLQLAAIRVAFFDLQYLRGSAIYDEATDWRLLWTHAGPWVGRTLTFIGYFFPYMITILSAIDQKKEWARHMAIAGGREVQKMWAPITLAQQAKFRQAISFMHKTAYALILMALFAAFHNLNRSAGIFAITGLLIAFSSLFVKVAESRHPVIEEKVTAPLMIAAPQAHVQGVTLDLQIAAPEILQIAAPQVPQVEVALTLEDIHRKERAQPLSPGAAALFRSEIRSFTKDQLMQLLDWAQTRSSRYDLLPSKSNYFEGTLYRGYVNPWILYHGDDPFLGAYDIQYKGIEDESRVLTINLAQQADLLWQEIKRRNRLWRNILRPFGINSSLPPTILLCAA